MPLEDETTFPRSVSRGEKVLVKKFDGKAILSDKNCLLLLLYQETKIKYLVDNSLT